MDTLFFGVKREDIPLAERVRPRTLNDFVGQKHILGSGKLLRRLIESRRLPNCIFYGPTGSGKTTLARIISENLDGYFIKMNAISSGVGEAKEVIEKAKKNFELYGRKTYLFLDECHRWSKAQSDCVLGAMEEGYLVFIGGTTENPSFALTRAILSRSTVFEFKRVDTEEIKKAVLNAVNSEVGLQHLNIKFKENSLNYLCTNSAGDVRVALNALEVAALTTPKDENAETVITSEILAESMQKKTLSLTDDVFFHILSAFCKSLRGSDETAALYYANRLIEAGCEPELLARRTIAHASEDVGLADPNALVQACSALFAIKNLGMPEGNLALTQAIIYVCKAPKSNKVVLAKIAAEDDARNNADDNIPNYLKNHTESAKNYKYPHNYPGGVVEQQYLPDSLKDRCYFKKK